ncbi:MAG TPA: amino acid ABC transporter permease [Acidimicrobiia bacterium]|nr:amino acid ABC transporter permease [Acidimicrobiia bacterium]
MTASAPTTLGTGTRAYRWARKNLFRTWLDALLTLFFGGFALYIVVTFLQFVFVTGRWGIIDVNLRLLLVGRWPADELSVIAVAVVVLGLWVGLIAGIVHGRQIRRETSAVASMSMSQRVSDLVRRFGLIFGTVLLLLVLTDTTGPWLMAGATIVAGVGGRILGGIASQMAVPHWFARGALLMMAAVPFALFFFLTGTVPLADWEGFYFNITSAIAGIILCFPLGVLLALARRSKLRLLQGLSVAYIEFVRGAPLFVLLLMANVSLEFFVPASLAPSKTIRAIVVFTIFTGAYLAEIVRGGLQSVPRGQEEAAKSLGLSPTKQMGLIVLPQALRNVIPAQIGQLISLFKDTTLAGLALGILDLLSAAQAITQQEGFRGQGLIVETLVFVGFLFWVGSFTMSRESQRLERKLGVGTR